MAEGGIVERIFGGAEGEEAEAESLASGADPMAAAVAMDAARFDPELSREAAAYLRKQAHLVDLQAEHLHEQRAVQLDHLKLRRVGERMRVAIQAFLIAVGALLGVAFLSSVWSAVNDHGLAVEPFSVPSDLVARGLTGQVVAKQVLDRLADLQDQTESIRAADTYKNDWGEDLKVEIPETGVSIGEVARYLKDMLGHETRISGELVRTPTVITVTARAGEGMSKSFSGSEAEIDSLIERVAEAVYGRTQPYRYANYLRTHGRAAEAKAIYLQLASSPIPIERAWAHLGLGYLSAMVADEENYGAECRVALHNVPDFAPALADLDVAEGNLQHDEAQLIASRQFLAAKRSIDKYVADDWRAYLIADSRVDMAALFQDSDAVIALAQPLITSPIASRRNEGLEKIVVALTFAHDYQGAKRLAGGSSPASKDALLGFIALFQDDAAALPLLRHAMAELDAGANTHDFITRSFTPLLALAEARSGDLNAARATAAATPLDCDLCVRARGTIASFAHDRAGTERWFALVIDRTSNLPQGYIDRGQARFRLGDLDGALADARATVRIAPHFADGYALWGDVLARKRRWREAQRHYRDALRFAPRWTLARRALDEVSRRS